MSKVINFSDYKRIENTIQTEEISLIKAICILTTFALGLGVFLLGVYHFINDFIL